MARARQRNHFLTHRSGCSLSATALIVGCAVSPAGLAQNSDTSGMSQAPLQGSQTNLEQAPVISIGPMVNPSAPAGIYGAPQSFSIFPQATTGTSMLPSPLAGTSALAASPVPAAPQAGQQVLPGFYSMGPVNLHAHLFYSITDGDGLQSTPGHRSSTVINMVSPGIDVNVGSVWTLQYRPNLTFYSAKGFQDTTDQNVALSGLTQHGNWSFGLTQTFSDTTDPLVETGTQTSQQMYTTGLSAGVQLGSRWSEQAQFSQSFRETQGFQNFKEWALANALDYELAKGLSVGLQLEGGYDVQSGSSDMPFEQAAGVLKFNPGKRLSLTLSGGAQEREFISPTAPATLTPIFNASVDYQMLEHTSVSLNASRTVTPSFYNNQIINSTRVNATLTQNLTKALSLQLSGGYSDQPSTIIEPLALPAFWIGPKPTSQLQQVRDDTTTSLGASLTYQLGSRAFAAVFFNYSDNSSSQENFSFSSRQYGFSITYSY